MLASEADQYLQRIGYAGPRRADIDVLRALHLAHLRTVPFENLSVRRGEPILLEEASLFDKIVRRRRGGFCYELNGLFAGLLRSLGFRVEMLSGRVGPDGIDFDHMTLRVDLNEPWLADVGFGDCFLEPLRLLDRGIQTGGDGRDYLLIESGPELILQRRREQEWERQYAFTLRPWALPDFEPGCRFHQTSPASTFTQKTVVSRATEAGRITLSELRLITTERGQRREEAIGPEAVDEVLARCFGIRMT